jgi:hypothetical protein
MKYIYITNREKGKISALKYFPSAKQAQLLVGGNTGLDKQLETQILQLRLKRYCKSACTL